MTVGWEVDWAHAGNTGTIVWARNASSRIRTAREWHWAPTGQLRRAGINTPTYRRDSWEVDWSCRNGKLVWARNQSSKMPSARAWHWVDFHTLERSGIRWQPRREKTGRYLSSDGYVLLTRKAMTDAEIALADHHDLFRGARHSFLREHHLVAVKKYGGLPAGFVVRHINGDKADNRPENLVLGTTQENTMDHNSARLSAMVWRERFERLRDTVSSRDVSGYAAREIAAALA